MMLIALMTMRTSVKIIAVGVAIDGTYFRLILSFKCLNGTGRFKTQPSAVTGGCLLIILYSMGLLSQSTQIVWPTMG